MSTRQRREAHAEMAELHPKIEKFNLKLRLQRWMLMATKQEQRLVRRKQKLLSILLMRWRWSVVAVGAPDLPLWITMRDGTSGGSQLSAALRNIKHAHTCDSTDVDAQKENSSIRGDLSRPFFHWTLHDPTKT